MEWSNILYFILCFGFCQCELPVHSSQRFVNNKKRVEFEIYLQDRSNITVEIKHSPTLSLSANESSQGTNVPKRKALPTLSQKSTTVPVVASVYQYDKSVVEIFRNVLKNVKMVENLTSQHLTLIERYVRDWDEIVMDPSTDVQEEEYFAEFEEPFVHLPKEIGEVYKLIRINNRVLVELPLIMRLSKSTSWHDIRIAVLNAQINAMTYVSSFDITNILKLSEMHFSNPKELFPDGVLRKIPIKDFITVALSSDDKHDSKEAARWIALAKDMLRLSAGDEAKDSKEAAEGTEPPMSSRGFAEKYIELLASYFENKKVLESKSEEIPAPGSPAWLMDNFRIEESSWKICAGEDLRTGAQKASLRCRLDHRNAAWLRLMPARVEQLHRDPEILFFHHVLTEDKIKSMQQLALPFMEVAQVNLNSHTVVTKKESRSSFNGFLDQNISKEVLHIDLISEYLTGLHVVGESDSEDLQMNVYRAGGFYKPHMDSRLNLSNATFKFEDGGDRLATLMFYLNDVEKGGRTAFVPLGFSSEPEKGGAVLWHSLSNAGEHDLRTIHAGCPVVSGVKWVANKWILYTSQLFKRPCSLHQQDL